MTKESLRRGTIILEDIENAKTVKELANMHNPKSAIDKLLIGSILSDRVHKAITKAIMDNADMRIAELELELEKLI
ncbi:MAG TPA: hypothetical protein VK625_11115 [Flavitalea sp.]|nr:hypothetical protein [Flavitalea sp.]